jgi:glycosyltransferase involved in cell wall biosynthesis
MAAYNHEKYVGRAIQSVLNQTLADFELVITDDGSRDRTAAEIEEFADARIRFFRFPANRGQFAATNHCLRQARGEYVAVLNSDDVFLPAKLEKQVGFLNGHPEVGAVFCRVRMIDEQDRAWHGKEIFRTANMSRFAWLNHFFYRGNCLCHPAVLLRRQCHTTVGGYDERYAQLADFDFWIRLCLQYEIHILPEELVGFRMLPQSGNMGSRRPDSIRRCRWEHRRIFDNFLLIDSPAVLRKVFPEANRYGDDIPRELLPFVLAMLALQAKSTRQIHQAFALDTLYRLLDNAQTAQQLTQRFGFDYRDLIRLTGQYDVCNIATIQQMRAQRRGGFRTLWRYVRQRLRRPRG